MITTLIFLNGYYDLHRLEFYRHQIEVAKKYGYPMICADGGIRIFDELNSGTNVVLTPDVLIGDLDSSANCKTEPKQIIDRWIGQTDKDFTDGQLAVKYAIDHYNSTNIFIYGGLPRSDIYETDHFLGNLKLMRYGYMLTKENRREYKAEMRDPMQTIHYVLSVLRMERKNNGLQRVSLLAEKTDVVVEYSQNLRWDLTSFKIDSDLVNALRNEFKEGVEWAQLKLVDDSAPVYVIHNWNE